MGRIDWGAYSGEDVERVLATFITKMKPDIVPIRPTQGDHGIDLISANCENGADVYQIKRFTNTITGSQKAKIKKSLQDCLSFLHSKKLELKTWYLVLPHNSSLDEREWFEELGRETGASLKWIGLDIINDWDAMMPEVTDRLFNGSSSAINRLVQQYLKAAHFPDLTDANEILNQLDRLRGLLNSNDPYYHYNISLYDIHDITEGDQTIRPGLLAAYTTPVNDDAIARIEVYANTSLSHQLAPITQTIVINCNNEKEIGSFEEFYKYGERFETTNAYVKLTKNLPFSEEGSELSFFSISSIPSKETWSISLHSKDSAIDMKQDELIEGAVGKRWRGKDRTGCINLTLSVEATEKGHLKGEIDFSIYLAAVIECPVAQLRLLLNLLHDSLSDPIVVEVDKAELASWQPEYSDDTRIAIERAHTLNRHLCTIDLSSHDMVLFPDMSEVTVKEFKDIELISCLLKNKYITQEWSDVTVVSECQVPDKPVLIQYIEPLKVSLAGQEHICGYCRHLLIAEAVSVCEVGEGRGIHFKPNMEIGNKHLMEIIQDDYVDQSRIGNVFMSFELPSKKEWELFCNVGPAAYLKMHECDRDDIEQDEE